MQPQPRLLHDVLGLGVVTEHPARDPHQARSFRSAPCISPQLLIRSDGAGASYKLVDRLAEQGKVPGRRVEHSVGFAVTEKMSDAIDTVEGGRVTHAQYPDVFTLSRRHRELGPAQLAPPPSVA